MSNDENQVQEYSADEVAEGKAVELQEIGEQSETITVQDAVDAEDQPNR